MDATLPSGYLVAREAPESVRSEVCRLWADNLNLEQPPEDKFRWLYRSGPHPAGAVFVLRWCDEGGVAHAVGTAGVALRRYRVASGASHVGVVGDLAVDPAHRGLLPALCLLRALREAARAELDVAYGFPNAKAEGVMLRAGFRRLGKARRHALVLRHAAYVGRVAERTPRLPAFAARALRHPWCAAVAGAALDVVRLASGAARTTRAAAGHRLAWTPYFDARFDALWQDAMGEYPIIGERTSAFLAWRYPDCDVATLLRRSDGALRAYAIVDLQRSTRAAHLHDLFGHQDDLAALIDLLLPALYLRGATSVSVRFLGAPYVAEILAARGFEPRDEGRTVVVQVGARQTAHRAVLEDPQNWHLFDDDEDV